MSELIDTTEMYLRTIYELGEEGIPPLRARIAERLKQSGPTVSQTVARMERDGLVSVDEDRHLALSELGRQRAEQVMRRHRLAECLLTQVIGVEWHLAHEEACRWEHVVSTDVERRLVTVLGSPTESPYGNPIPGLAALGVSEASIGFLDGVESLTARLKAVGEQVVTIVRLSELIQSEPGTLQLLVSVDALPGKRVSAASAGQFVVLGEVPSLIRIDQEQADHIFVAVD